MAEWSIAAVLKTVDLKGSRGSNPCLSAKCEKSASSLLECGFFRALQGPAASGAGMWRAQARQIPERQGELALVRVGRLTKSGFAAHLPNCFALGEPGKSERQRANPCRGERGRDVARASAANPRETGRACSHGRMGALREHRGAKCGFCRSHAKTPLEILQRGFSIEIVPKSSQ